MHKGNENTLKINEFKAVIFDMDGVLVNSEPIRTKCWRDIFLKNNIEVSLSQIKKYNGKLDKIMLLDFIKMGFISSKISIENLMNEHKELYYHKADQGIPEIKGVLKFIKHLADKKQLAVATSSYKHSYEYVLSRNNLKQYFSVIAGLEDGNRPKPEPDVYNAVLDKLKLKPKDCIVFEDSESGISAALNAKIENIVGVATNSTKKDLIQLGATYAIRDFNNKILYE